MIRYFIIAIYLGLTTYLIGQSYVSIPPWVRDKQLPPSTKGVTYRSFHEEGSSIEIIRESTKMALISELASKRGLDISGVQVLEKEKEKNYNSKGLKGITSSISSRKLYELKGESFIASFYLADEYFVEKNGMYQFWGLYAFTEDGKQLVFEPIEYTTEYGTPPIWRSALVPGWGQFYKKKTRRGIAILASESVLITATIICEKQRAVNIRKSAETLNIDIVKEYRKRADTWELRRNLAIGGAIAVYAVNLLDAALGKGQVKYAYIPENIGLFAYSDGQINQYGVQIKF